MAANFGPRAVLQALRFHGADGDTLRGLPDAEWDAVLRFCDQSQLTLIAGAVCGDFLPTGVRERIEKDACKNVRKFARLKNEFHEIAGALEREKIDFAVLKGFAHAPDFTPDPLLRAQGDIDLWLEPATVHRANDVLLRLGYVPHCETENRHLPPLIWPSDWQWKGDFYDPEIPISVDLHYQLWDSALERIEAPGWEDFWTRRITRDLDGRTISVLHPADALAFAALHQLLHVLRGDARMQRAWEIGRFLENRATDDEFWSEWTRLHPERLRRLETVVFHMSADWFGCDLHPRIREEVERLPDNIKLWFDRHAFSPVDNLFVPNKNELWLHLALAESFRDRASVFRRRMIPLKRLDPNAPDEQVGWRKRLEGLAWSAKRVGYHASVFPKALWEGARWWGLCQGLSAPLIRFLTASLLFDIGAFVFFVLYNLYLLDLGHHEKFLGLVASAMTAGTLTASLPAAALARRFGLRRTVLTAILGGAVAAAARALVPSQEALLVSAFLHGVFLSFWAVSTPPAIAALSTEKNRNFAFSLVFGLGIGTGIVGGLIAGFLPKVFSTGLFPGALFHMPPLGAKRTALLVSAAVLAMAGPLALRIRLAAAPEAPAPKETKLYPRTPFVIAFMIALFLWMFATGACNPFFNAYFAGPGHFRVESIGILFSASQLVQVGAVLLAPLCFQKLGEVKGVASMQFATALVLAALAMLPAGSIAAGAYCAYMAFQYMSSPGVFSMLMARVKEQERHGASALNFTITSLAGMLASFAGGSAIGRFGYPLTLAAAGLLAAIAAAVFGILIPRTQTATSNSS